MASGEGVRGSSGTWSGDRDRDEPARPLQPWRGARCGKRQLQSLQRAVWGASSIQHEGEASGRLDSLAGEVGCANTHGLTPHVLRGIRATHGCFRYQKNRTLFLLEDEGGTKMTR